MSVFSWLRPAALAATIIAASNLLAPAPAQAQGITVLRGSTPQRYSPIDCNDPDYARYCQDNQPSSYSAYSDENDYPYYGDDFPLAVVLDTVSCIAAIFKMAASAVGYFTAAASAAEASMPAACTAAVGI